MNAARQPTEEQRDEAALWLAKRAGGSLSPAEGAELEVWLNADPRHRQAFDELRVVWAQLEAPAAQIARHHPPRTALGRYVVSPRGWFTAVSAGLAAVLLAWFFNPSLIENWRADVVSGHEIVSAITLPDGSLAKLGADTALDLQFDETRRHVVLLRGEAFFEVVPGSTPPFTVGAGGDTVRVTGTGFNVARFGGENVVTVEHGSVEVSGARGGEPEKLSPGQRVIVRDGRPSAAEIADLDSDLAWIAGRLVVQQGRVGDVAERLARQLPGRLVVRGEIASRRISGTFPLDDAAGSLQTVAEATGGTLVRTPWLTVLF